MSGARGLPGDLPPGETLLWQGAPRWWSLARHCFHVPVLAIYFAALLAWYALHAALGHTPFAAAASGTGKLAICALLALGLLTLYAFLVQRTTVYSVTSARVVLSFGIAMPIVVNIPFRMIEGAGLRGFADGSGDIALRLGSGGKRPGFVLMWPHTRPWRLLRGEPMLRGLPDATRAAQILGRALAASAGQQAQAAPLPPAAGAVRGAAEAAA